MKTLILSSNNVVDGTGLSVYRYQFPAGGAKFENHELALLSCSAYYSWYNVSSSDYSNTTFQYTWRGGTTETVTLDGGFYEIADTNAYLQSYVISKKHYLTDSGGNCVYYLEVLTNSTYYSVQLNCYAVPTPGEAPALGYSQPTGASWSFPDTATTPQFITSSSNNFRKVVGFSSGTYPPETQDATYSVLSNDDVPQVSPVSNVVVKCSLLQNKYAVPDTLLYSFSPSVGFGSQVTIEPSEKSLVDMRDGQHTEVEISFWDQDLNRLPIKDSQIVVILGVRKSQEH